MPPGGFCSPLRNELSFAPLLEAKAPLASAAVASETPPFVDAQVGSPPMRDCAVAWGDYDNDGRLDALITGYTAPGSVAIRQPAQLWRNTPTGFVKLEVDFPRISSDSVAFGDYDHDGRLDLLLVGYLGLGNMAAQVWHNQTPANNSPPTSPAGLAAEVTALGVRLQWAPATDAETPAAGLTYNLRVGTAPGAFDIVSPHSSGRTR